MLIQRGSIEARVLTEWCTNPLREAKHVEDYKICNATHSHGDSFRISGKSHYDRRLVTTNDTNLMYNINQADGSDIAADTCLHEHTSVVMMVELQGWFKQSCPKVVKQPGHFGSP